MVTTADGSWRWWGERKLLKMRTVCQWRTWGTREHRFRGSLLPKGPGAKMSPGIVVTKIKGHHLVSNDRKRGARPQSRPFKNKSLKLDLLLATRSHVLNCHIGVVLSSHFPFVAHASRVSCAIGLLSNAWLAEGICRPMLFDTPGSQPSKSLMLIVLVCAVESVQRGLQITA